MIVIDIATALVIVLALETVLEILSAEIKIALEIETDLRIKGIKTEEGEIKTEIDPENAAMHAVREIALEMMTVVEDVKTEIAAKKKVNCIGMCTARALYALCITYSYST